MAAAERFGIQLPRARLNRPSKTQRSRARSGLLQCRVRRTVLAPSFHLLPVIPYDRTLYIGVRMRP